MTAIIQPSRTPEELDGESGSMNMEAMQTKDESAPELDVGPTVGDELRLLRTEAGQSISDVAEAVRIQKRYLEALEEGRIRDLPGTVYALGFVRTYADYLGLDGAEMVARFKEEAQGLEREVDLTLPEPIDDSKVPTTAIFIIALVLAAVAYGAWYFLSKDDTQVSGVVPEVPERLAGLIEGDAGSAAGDAGTSETVAPVLPTPVTPAEPAEAETVAPAETAAAPETPAPEVVPPTEIAATPEAPAPETVSPTETAAAPPAPEEPAPVVAEPAVMAPSEPVPAPAVETTLVPETTSAPETASAPEVAAATPAEETPVAGQSPPLPPLEEINREPRVYGLGNVDARIVIIAVEDAWVEVTDVDGALLFSRVLRKGDSYRAPNRPGAVFVTGNAGGLSVTVDGVPAPALGPAGVVRRNVRLEPDLLKVGTAWP